MKLIQLGVWFQFYLVQPSVPDPFLHAAAGIFSSLVNEFPFLFPVFLYLPADRLLWSHVEDQLLLRWSLGSTS